MPTVTAWRDVISATHGVFITTQGQADAWETMIEKAIPDLKKGEIEKALYEAMGRSEQTEGYRLTVKDVIKWIRMSRNNWAEHTIIRDGWEYFPDRPRICGQIQSRRVIKPNIHVQPPRDL